MSRWLLNISKDRESTTNSVPALSHPLLKKCVLMFRGNLLCLSLCSLPLVLSLKRAWLFTPSLQLFAHTNEIISVCSNEQRDLFYDLQSKKDASKTWSHKRPVEVKSDFSPWNFIPALRPNHFHMRSHNALQRPNHVTFSKQSYHPPTKQTIFVWQHLIAKPCSLAHIIFSILSS